MSVGNLLHLQAMDYMANGRDMITWDVLVDTKRFDAALLKRELFEKTPRWQKPLQVGSDVYVPVERFFRNPRCYRFNIKNTRDELERGTVVYPPVFGPYFMLIIPEQRFGYDIRRHILQTAFVEETAACSSIILGTEGMAAMTLRDGTYLEGKILEVPDEVRVHQSFSASITHLL